MIQVLPSWFLSYESSWRYDVVVSTDDILILSLLSSYNALINVGGFYLIHLRDSCSFNKNSSANISRSPFIKLIIYSTRFVIIKTFIKKIFASTKVISESNIGEKVFIPRLFLSPSDVKIPFKFQRRQFPISVSFAMTINKSQWQSLKNVGIYLPSSVFSHGQLYVAISRVTSKQGLKILIVDGDGGNTNMTSNVVYHEVFRNVSWCSMFKPFCYVCYHFILLLLLS